MSTRSIGLSEQIHGYVLDSLVREPDILSRLRKETSELSGAGMQISPEQGRFMGWLVRSLGAEQCLEVGVFTGYSSLSVALALPPEGRLVACDRSEEWTRIAKRYWEEAGQLHKIDLRIGPALESLDALLASGRRESFDFAFIDADKENSFDYYERCIELVRPGGVVAFDNALWGGKVADPSIQDPGTVAIRKLNSFATVDRRVDTCLLPIGDGLLLSRKLAH